MSSRSDKKMARLMTNRIIKFRGGWKDGLSRRRRRRARRLLYEAILWDIGHMSAVLEALFAPHPVQRVILNKWFKNVE